MSEADFWNNRQSAESVSREARMLEDTVRGWESLQQQAGDLAELLELTGGEDDAETAAELAREVDELVVAVADMELRTTLSDVDDPKSAILIVHSGAGGTEAADWAEMLMRMYTRWAERHQFDCNVLDLAPGDEAVYR